MLRIQTHLVVYAALLLGLMIAGAAAWHLTRGETTNIVTNIILASMAGIVAYGRSKLAPLPDKNGMAEPVAG